MTLAITKPLLTAFPNFRDVGGHAAHAGRTVSKGMIYRSGVLDGLDTDGLSRLEGLGIALCCDLRSSLERQRTPARWMVKHPPRDLWLAVNSDVRAMGPDLSRLFAQKPGRDGALQMMLDLYRRMPLLCIPILARLLAELAHSSDALPMVVHCTAGKDRTGFVIAMILRVLGVSHADIEADYLRSNELCDRNSLDAKVGVLLRELIGQVPDDAALEAINAVHPDYLGAAYNQIDADYGSFESYLEHAVQVDAVTLNAARSRLLR